MHKRFYILILHFLISLGLLLCSLSSNAQVDTGITSGPSLFIFLIIILIIILLATLIMAVTTKRVVIKNRKRKIIKDENKFTDYLKNLDSDQIETLLKKKKTLDNKGKIDVSKRNSLFLIGALFSSFTMNAQTGN